MCFPSKKQKSNFADQPEIKAKPADSSAPTNALSSSASKPPPDPTSTAPAENTTNMAPKVAIIIYSMYGHIAKMAEGVKAGIEEAGGSVSIFQIAETLPQEILTKMHAPPKPDYPIFQVAQLADYDGFILGIPTRYGNFPAQWKVFWDSTGQLWATGALVGKYASVFVSTAGPGGGQETTASNAISTFVHHGINFVPLGYGEAYPALANTTEVHGGSPWGAGTYSNSDGSRQPTELELGLAKLQGKRFWGVLSKAF